MSFDLNSIKKNKPNRTPLMVLHGTPGIGKTTFSASLPSPLFIMTDEGGLGDNQVDAFPICKSYEDVFNALKTCYQIKKGDKETLVIDSLSSLEPLIWEKVALEDGKHNIEDLGFGKGYQIALSYWQEIIQGCRGLINKEIFKRIILIAHSDIVRFESPDSESYDRYGIKLHKKAVQLFYEQADIIAFASQPTFIRQVDETGKVRAVAGKKGGTILHLKETPSLIAKNRYSLPDKINFTAEAFMNELKGVKKDVK